MSNYVPSTEEVRAYSNYTASEFDRWFAEATAEAFRLGYKRAAGDFVAEALSGWVGWFELNDSHVGGKQTFTAYEVAELLRGPEPFGFTATNHETGEEL